MKDAKCELFLFLLFALPAAAETPESVKPGQPPDEISTQLQTDLGALAQSLGELKGALDDAVRTAQEIANAKNSSNNGDKLTIIRNSKRALGRALSIVKSIADPLRQTKMDIDNKRDSLNRDAENKIFTTDELSAEINQNSIAAENETINVKRAQNELTALTAERASERDGIAAYIRERGAALALANVAKAKYQKLLDLQNGRNIGKELYLNKVSSDKIGNELSLVDGYIRRGDFYMQILDDLADSLVSTVSDFNQYTVWSTVVFGVILTGVIGGFFLIALRTPTIGSDFFRGEAGIQFVTLFSLIIAIILFGVLKILEGKELSALLGGLSGYILGRGTGASNIEGKSPSSQSADAYQASPQGNAANKSS